MNKKSNV